MITSTSNAQVKALSKLIKNARARRQQQVYIVEGIRMFRETPEDRIEKIYASESFVKEHETLLAGKDWEMLSDSVFASVSDTKTPQGVLCLVKMRENRLEDMLQQKNGLWLILENVQDPGNLGTMFRTGEGAGIARCDHGPFHRGYLQSEKQSVPTDGEYFPGAVFHHRGSA